MKNTIHVVRYTNFAWIDHEEDLPRLHVLRWFAFRSGYGSMVASCLRLDLPLSILCTLGPALVEIEARPKN